MIKDQKQKERGTQDEHKEKCFIFVSKTRELGP